MGSTSFYWKRAALVGVVALLLLLVAGVFGGRVLDGLTSKEVASEFYVAQASGEHMRVLVVKRTHGFFISGGHGWSLGDTRDEYEVSFEHEARTLRWQGPGVPIILRGRSGSFYLATFDRETSPSEADFRCYVWEGGGWKDLPVRLFPRSLALLNLMSLGSGSEAAVTEPAFRMSLLARFWFCLDSGLPYREVNDSMVTEEFVRRFAPEVKRSFFER